MASGISKKLPQEEKERSSLKCAASFPKSSLTSKQLAVDMYFLRHYQGTYYYPLEVQ